MGGRKMRWKSFSWDLGGSTVLPGEKEEVEVWIINDKFFHPIKNVLYFPKLLAI